MLEEMKFPTFNSAHYITPGLQFQDLRVNKPKQLPSINTQVILLRIMTSNKYVY
jgi:uncharacterized RDD family membrane protein YckC